MSPQTEPEEPAGSEGQFVLAVTVKDEHENADPGPVAESEYLSDSQTSERFGPKKQKHVTFFY